MDIRRIGPGEHEAVVDVSPLFDAPAHVMLTWELGG